MASSYVGGLSGAFIPVSEDQGMINAVEAGALTLEQLEAMTCVCSVGLDMIAIPGTTSAATISGIIADETAIGMINQKTTAVRIIPVVGKEVGDTVEFGGLLGYAPVMPVNRFSCEAFVNRKGRIPAPIHSFKKLIIAFYMRDQPDSIEKNSADFFVSRDTASLYISIIKCN